MKNFSLITILLINVLGFSQTNQENKLNRFPNKLENMFTAHGSYEIWDKMNQLSFNLIKKNGVRENHKIDLKSRKTLITSSKFIIGFDGNEVWMNAEGKFPIERARFYHNLYFYFYAMPFVLGDPGISYKKVKDLNFENINYTGYKVTYGSEIGDSPDDNYFVYFDKKSNQMAWLGYTVTYGEAKPSTEIHYIKYTNWENINGLVLPKRLQWYETFNNLPSTPSNIANFDNISISDKILNPTIFIKPLDALIGNK